MKKYIVIFLLLVLLATGCSRDWDIADSGLNRDSSVPPGPGGEVVNNDGVFDDQSNNNPSNSPDQDPGSSSPPGQYDPNAEPPKILDPIMGSAWREFTNAPIQNKPGTRSTEAYLAVLLQFNVDGGYTCRYTPSCGGTSDTRCNIYASDVMNAMGAPLPTKGDLGVGHGASKNTDPMPANAKDTYAWLEKEQDGWRKLDPNNASDWAVLIAHIAVGKPALASHPDHIAVIRPDQPGSLATGDTGGLHIAQAGAYNSNDTLIKSAFGSRQVNIYIHD